jgi:arylsulfatase A-like enzyme
LHYNLDLPPTLAELFGKPAPECWDGRSYLPAVVKGEECGRESLVLGQCAHGCQRSVRFGKWIYIRTYHDHYHLFPKEMLFDIENDPHEQHNVAAENVGICRQAAHIMLEWHDEMMAKGSSDRDPLWTVMHEGGPFHSRGYLKEYCTYLDKTERGAFIPELKAKHPEEFRTA